MDNSAVADEWSSGPIPPACVTATRSLPTGSRSGAKPTSNFGLAEPSPAAMRSYLAGHEPDFWLPNPPEADYRYALGRLGRIPASSNSLVVLGMNPSHASELKSDATVNNVVAASAKLGYTGWVMLNLYPERASSSANLRAFDQHVSDSNAAFIEQFLRAHGITEVLGAWGDLPNSTIRRAKPAVLQALASVGARIFYFGALTAKGEPRHLNPRGPKLDMTAPKHYYLR